MRILMLCDKLGLGGAETHILTLVLELVKRGARVTLISAGGEYEAPIKSLGVRCIRAPLDKRDPISIFKSGRIIRRYMRECEVVHAHTRLTAFLAKRARRGNFPRIVVTAHLDFKRSGVGRLSYFGDYTLAVSEDVKEHLIREYSLRNDKIGITRNGIDLERFSRHGENGELKISHVSRLDNDRADIAFMLTEIAPKLSNEYPDVRIQIIGTGERYSELLEKAKLSNKMAGREVVALEGGRSDVERCVAGSTLFVGVSRAALEAMALGVACIIAGNDGYGGVICKDNITNLTKTNFCARGFEKATAEKLYSDISMLLKNGKMRAALSDKQYELIQKLYSSKSMCEDAFDAYERVGAHPRVCVLGYFGFGNIGDELTLRYCIEALKSRGVTELSVFTKSSIPNMAGVNQVSRVNPFKVLITLLKNDVMILGGGNLLQNESSTLSLLYYTAFIILARLLGVRIYFLSSGIGALRGKFAELLAKISLRRADFIGARTEFDKARFESLCGIKCRIMPDFCFLHSRKGTVSNRTAISMDGNYILLIASCYGDATVRRAVELKGRLSCELYVCTMFESVDSEKISRACRRDGLLYLKLESSEELFSLIQNARLVISERLHGAIISAAQKKLSLLSVTTEKNRALISEVKRRAGLYSLILPINEPLNIKDIKEVGARSSDFDRILSVLCDDIDSTLDEIF